MDKPKLYYIAPYIPIIGIFMVGYHIYTYGESIINKNLTVYIISAIIQGLSVGHLFKLIF